jgi:ubiquinone/menaquinone biosynthesis C-methylase UbiE
MNFYDRHVLPHLINWGCGLEVMAEQRQRIVPRARGRVLEIGVGSGLNLAYYDPRKVDAVVGIDPGEEILALAAPRAASMPFSVELLAESAEQISLPSQSFDSVVMTFSLCTIPHPEAALAEIRRLLKPEGQLLFSEHGRAPETNISRWQDRVNPLWGKIAGGCNLNRNIDHLISAAGFRIDEMEAGYLPGVPLKIAGYQYVGVAVPDSK